MNTGFEVKAETISYSKTHNGWAFTAELLFNGETIGPIEHDGNGGDTYAFIRSPHREALEAEANEVGMRTEYYLHRLMDFAEGLSDSKSGE